ncbi:MAG: DUF222 domain-containing protein [Gammaproteobacteria bacterium]
MAAVAPLIQVPDSPFSTCPIPENDESLRDAITLLSGHINAAEYRFLKLLAALIKRDAWLGDSGFKTPAHWLNYACGIGLGAAREKVRVAKCLHSLPKIDEAFRLGTISYSKVRAMTRCATPENEAHLLMIAQHGTAQHVENLVRKHCRARRLNAPEQDQTQHEARQFTWYTDDDGMLVFQGKLIPEDGAVFLKALEAWFDVINRRNKENKEKTTEEGDMRQKDVSAETSFSSSGTIPEPSRPEIPENVSAEMCTVPSSGKSPENARNVSAETSAPELPEPTYAQKRADALVLMAEQALSSLDDGLKPLSNPEKYQIIVHLEPEQLHRWPEHPEHPPETCVCSLEYGNAQFPLSAATARRLACDAALVPVLEDGGGDVLNVGRKTRTVPPALRRALKLRDQGCRFPGCTQTRYVDAHHVRHWCDGGETSLDNLITLCRHHHRLLHQSEYEIGKEANGDFVFMKPDGEEMSRALPQQFEDGEDTRATPAIVRQHEALGLAIDSGTAVSLWQGEECDYALAVEALMAVEPNQGDSAPRHCF